MQGNFELNSNKVISHPKQFNDLRDIDIPGRKNALQRKLKIV